MKEILLLIASILDDGFIPECGSDFKPDDCEGCQLCGKFQVCKHQFERDNKVKELKQLINDDMHLY